MGIQMITYRIRLFLCLIALVAIFAMNAAAQIAPGTLTGGATPWPVYVYDTETLNKGNVILSGIGGVGFLADNSKSYSIYSGLDLGITNRFLISIAVSGSTGETTGWQLDDTVFHAKYKVVDRDSFDFAVAGNIERLPFMEDAGHTAFDGQIMGIVQKSAGQFAAYGQLGYSSRKQLFEGFGARYDFSGKAIVSGNFSYRHEGSFYEGLLPEDLIGVRATIYATVYVPVGSRVGLTGAVGRTLLPVKAGDPAAYYCTFGLGVRLH
jgi:hypothetical protein